MKYLFLTLLFLISCSDPTPPNDPKNYSGEQYIELRDTCSEIGYRLGAKKTDLKFEYQGMYQYVCSLWRNDPNKPPIGLYEDEIRTYKRFQYIEKELK